MVKVILKVTTNTFRFSVYSLDLNDIMVLFDLSTTQATDSKNG